MKKIFSSLLMATMMISMIPLQSSALVVLPGSGEPNPATVKAAFAEFKSLSKKEQKTKNKRGKKTSERFLRKKRNQINQQMLNMWLLIVLAILLPPLAVYLHQGEINGKFWLSILFWFLFIIPGVVYALLVVTDTI